MKPPAPLLFLVLAATACAPSVNNSQTFPPAAPPSQPAPPAEKRVVTDPSLRGVIRVVKVNPPAKVDGYLKIQVVVQNQGETPRRFRYAIEWLDQNGAVLPLASNGFLDWTLLAHETSSITAMAPAPAAEDFRITFLGPAQ